MVYIMLNFKYTYSLKDGPGGRPQACADNITAVRACVTTYPTSPIYRNLEKKHKPYMNL